MSSELTGLTIVAAVRLERVSSRLADFAQSFLTTPDELVLRMRSGFRLAARLKPENTPGSPLSYWAEMMDAAETRAISAPPLSGMPTSSN